MQTKRIIIIVATILLAVVALSFLYLIYQEKQTTKLIEKQESILKKQTGTKPLSKEEKEMVRNTKTIQAILKQIEINEITVQINNQEMSFTIPEQNVNFVKQTQTEDEIIVNQEIGLFDLPLDREVEIQYNANNNEVMMVVWEDFE